MRTFLTSLVLFLITAPSLLAHFSFTPTLQQAYHAIQELRLSKAKQILNSTINKDASKGIIHYLDNYHDLHYLLLSEDKEAYSRFLKQVDYRYDQLDTFDESPYKLFIQAELKLHTAFAKLKFGNEISGCRDIIKSYGLLNQNRKKYPTFLPTLKSLGLLHVLIGCVPDKYKWVTKILGLNGSIKQGIKELKEVQQQSDLFAHETKLIDYMLHAYILDPTTQITTSLERWCQEKPKNLLLHFLTTAILKKEGKTDAAFYIVSQAPSGKEYLPIPVMDYMKAELLLHQGKYTQSIKQYEDFLSSYKGINFLKDSHYKIFICYWLSSQETIGKKYLIKVKTIGSTVTEADQFAQRFTEQYLADIIGEDLKPLYRARYFSDGGYQNKASIALQDYKEDSFSSIIGKAEFNYRKGRIYQKSNEITKAIPYYKRAITLSESDSYYFGANAALQLGYIYQDLKQAASARQYFKKAILFKKHEYKNSIDNKAKAALQKLEN